MFTNTDDAEELANIRKQNCFGADKTKRLDISIEKNLEHPFNLTWQHKRLIPDVFLAPGSRYSHFLYLEDDLLFSFRNYQYFCEFREALAARGLLPGFLRVEYNKDKNTWVNTDHREPITIRRRWECRVGETRFVNPVNPYTATMLLDRAMAETYVQTDAFDMEGSKTHRKWSVRERTSIGLLFHEIPDGWRSRAVVPVADEHSVPTECWIWHMPNTYAENPRCAFGKIGMGELFVEPT